MTSEGVIVTGASGFIGSQLVKNLVARNRAVTATARRATEALTAELGTQVLPLDVLGDFADTASVFNGTDTLVHCATPNDIQSRDQDGGMALGVTGTFRLIEEAARQGIKRVIYLSTLQVYGTELEGEIDELTPVDCQTAYGLNHFLGEEVCRLAARRHGIDVVSLRPSNVYGVPSVSTVNRSTLVPMCFVRDAKSTGIIELRSSGRQVRNFISTEEVAETIVSILDDFPKGYTVINAVSDWHPRIVDIAQMVVESWAQLRSDPCDLRILSEQPANPPGFTVRSRVLSHGLTAEQSDSRMSGTIATLIEQNHWT